MWTLLLACAAPSDDTKAPDAVDDSAADTGDTALPDACPARTAPVWQAWDDGDPGASMKRYEGRGWTGADGEPYDLYATPGWEAVRFEMANPACIYAVRVMWAKEPTGAAVGLYSDFGHNGMDFHPDPPLWTATADAGITGDDGWTVYEVDPPLPVAGPALVYGAIFRDGENGPTLKFDNGVSDSSCAAWDDCHSVLNYPSADASSYYTGTTYPWQYDFLVQVELEDVSVIPDEDLWFHADPALSTGGNVSWGDYDDDGDDDLMAGGPVLWRNDAGTFTDVSAESGVQAPGVGTSGGVWGDYDNDGCLDYFGIGGSYVGGELLLHANCDGTFSDATLLAGIDDTQSDRSCLGSGEPEHSPTAGAAWTDFDNDGLLDLVQANFLCFDSYTNYPDRFWHNQGGGVFAEWGTDHGFEWDDNAGRGAATLDVDLDGDLDLAILSYVLQADLFYVNEGAGQFTEAATDLGLAGTRTVYGRTGYYGHGIGLVWGDLENDGDWDAVYANLAHPRFYQFSDRTNLLIGDAGTWTNEADARGIQYHETHSNPSLLDFENDGDLDLTITEVYAGRPTDVYVNDGTARFREAMGEAGITVEGGWGSAVADYDGDGDQDLVAYSLFRNDIASGHWLSLRLVGDVTSNRAAIGAIAWVHGGGKTWMRSVSGGNGTGCQDSQTLHVGLGEVDTIDAVEVWFPGGETVSYAGVGVDSGWRLTESGGVSQGLEAP